MYRKLIVLPLILGLTSCASQPTAAPSAAGQQAIPVGQLRLAPPLIADWHEIPTELAQSYMQGGCWSSPPSRTPPREPVTRL